MNKILCISGKAMAGKDSTANILKTWLESNGERVLIIHMADYLKFICQKYYGWNGKANEGARLESGVVARNILDIQIKKKSFTSKCHKYFTIYNINPKGNKTFDNNILEQGCYLNVLGMHINIYRKRAFCDVRNLDRFLNNYDYRVGHWNWRNNMWY